MHTAFSERLSALRKERGLTQKEAAEKLGVSAALLSHYEKGIRECGLSFLCKAAAFYDVSCDYILGVTESRRSFRESYDAHNSPQDAEYRTATLFRAAVMLGDDLSAVGESARIRDFFALAIYRVAARASEKGVVPRDWISLPPASADALCRVMMDNLLKMDIPPLERQGQAKQSLPLCLQTVIANSEQFLQKEFSAFLKKN